MFNLVVKTAPPKSDVPEAKISDVIDPGSVYRIWFQGSYWTAHLITAADLKVRDNVRVLGHKKIGHKTSNILLIESL